MVVKERTGGRNIALKMGQSRGFPALEADTFERIDWLRLAKCLWSRSNDDRLSLIASGVAFNAFLALVPLLTSVVLTYGLVASPESVAAHIRYLSQFLPRDAAAFLGGQLHGMAVKADTRSGLGLVTTLGLALYSGVRGSAGLVSGLNAIFDVEESRPAVWRYAIAAAITAALMLAFLIGSAGISVIGFLSVFLPNIGGVVDKLLQLGYWAVAAATVSVLVSLVYRLAPNRGDLGWRWITPGSLLATILWLIATWAFGFYVHDFGDYRALYGALGAVIILLLWLYLSAYILLLGAELNEALRRGDGQPED